MSLRFSKHARPIAFVIALVIPVTTFAQEIPETPSEAPSPEPVPAAPTQPPLVPGTACLVANNGLDDATARTAGQIVCDEIRNQGVTLVATTNVMTAYRVSFDRLGRDLIVRVAYEAPVGTVIRMRRIVLAGPEEVPVAAPRIARAVVRDEPLAESQRVDNLVKEETRKYEKKSGEFLWGFGILGVSGPKEGVWMTPGIEFMGYYETPELGFGFSARVGFEGEGDARFSSSSLTLGGRYFLTDGNTSPFVGAGLGISTVSVDDSEFNGSGTGLGAFGEVGVELMRLHGSRFILGLRLDAPFYQVKTEYYEPVEERYEMPLTVSATYAW